MDIQQILRWIVIAIVMIVAVVLLDVMLGLVGPLLKIALYDPTQDLLNVHVVGLVRVFNSKG